MPVGISPDNNLPQFNQILADADALLSGVAGQGITGTSTSPAALGSLGALDLADIGSGLSNDIASTLNQTVLGVHQAAEAFADQNGIAGLVHGVTNLGETLGLGHIGQPGNLVTDALAAPTAVASGDTGALAPIVPDVTNLEPAVTGLLSGGAGDAGVNPSALGLLSDTGDLSTTSVETLLNGGVDNFHSAVEATFDQTPLINTVHSVIDLGNAIGLGELGGSNLLTDLANLPSDLAAGNLTPLENLPADVAQILAGVEAIPAGVLADLSNGAILSDPVGSATGLADELANGGLDTLLNGIVDDIHTTAEAAADQTPLLETVHGIVGVGNAVGLGDLGGSNLLTDVLNTPGAVASGSLAPVENLPADTGTILGSVGTLANDVGTDLGNSPVIGTLEHPASGGGLLGGDLPAQGALGDATSLVNDVLPTATGLTGTLAGLPGGLTGSENSLLGTVTSTLGGAGHLGGLTGTLDGLTSGLNGSSGSGSHDLATVAVGPQTSSSGLQVDALSNGQGGSTHLVDTHVGTASADTPTLANIGLLTGGSSFHFPTASGGGDALSGLASSLASSATHAVSGAPAADAAPVAHVDLPAAAPHADPFAALAHPVLHAA